jgi:hypothetical protein
MERSNKALNQKAIYFRNDTEIPVMIQNWCPYLEDSQTMRTMTIAPQENETLFCVIGEWYVNIVPEDPNTEPTPIATLWCQPSGCGDYSFMETDDFACEYNNIAYLGGTVYGMITLKDKQSEKRILERTRMIEEELLQNRFHPRNIPKFVEWGWSGIYYDDE